MSIAAGAAVIGSLTSLSREMAGIGLDFSGNSHREYNSEYLAAMASSTSGAGIAGLFSAGLLAFQPKATLTGRLAAQFAVYEGEAGQLRSSIHDKFSPEATRNRVTDRNLLYKKMNVVKADYEGATSYSPAMSSAILALLAVVESLELSLGFGMPCEGDDLKAGSDQFTSLYRQLGSAFAGDGWQGDASQAYSSQNEVLRNRARAMADSDLELAGIVKDQADWNTRIRLGWALLKGLLIEAFACELVIYFTPDPLGARTFSIVVCALGVGIVLSMMGALIYFSATNGHKANALAVQYQEAGAGLVLSGASVQTEAADAGGSTVSRFETLSNAVSSTPDANGRASERGSADERDPHGTSTRGGEGRWDSSPAAQEPPASTMPNLAQVAAWSQPFQSAQTSPRIPATTEPGHSGAAPDEQKTLTGIGAEEATLATDFDGIGAGAGAEAGRRAPIGTDEIGREQVQGPNRREHSERY